MNIEIRTHQVSKSSWATEAFKTYSKKISHFCGFEFKQLKSEKSLIQNISPQDKVILCDERGKNFSSREFAKKIEVMRDSGSRKIIIIIGGPFGAEEDVKERADLTITLSSFVMNQEVALVTLFEQVFRAFTIINNHPYHND